MNDQNYPKWIYYYLWFVTCVSATLAFIIYTNPLIMWGNWEAAEAQGAFSLIGPTGLFCARNLGTAAMGIYALTRKSRSMMEAFLVFRITVDLLDGTHALIGGNPPIVFIGFSTAALEAFMFFKLRQFAKQQTS